MIMLLGTQSGAIGACVVGLLRMPSRDMRGSLDGVSVLLGYDGIITVSCCGYDGIMTGVRMAEIGVVLWYDGIITVVDLGYDPIMPCSRSGWLDCRFCWRRRCLPLGPVTSAYINVGVMLALSAMGAETSVHCTLNGGRSVVWMMAGLSARAGTVELSVAAARGTLSGGGAGLGAGGNESRGVVGGINVTNVSMSCCNAALWVGEMGSTGERAMGCANAWAISCKLERIRSDQQRSWWAWRPWMGTRIRRCICGWPRCPTSKCDSTGMNQ